MKSQSFVISKKKKEKAVTSWRHMLAQAEALRHGCAISLISPRKNSFVILWEDHFLNVSENPLLIDSLAQVFWSSIFLPAGAIISMTTQAGPIIFAVLFFWGKKGR